MRVKTTICYCGDCLKSIVYEQIFVSEMNPTGHSFIMKKCGCGKIMETVSICSSAGLPVNHRLELTQTAQKILTPLTIKA